MTARLEEKVIRALEEARKAVLLNTATTPASDEFLDLWPEIRRRVKAAPEIERLLVEARKYMGSVLTLGPIERAKLFDEINAALGGKVAPAHRISERPPLQIGTEEECEAWAKECAKDEEIRLLKERIRDLEKENDDDARAAFEQGKEDGYKEGREEAGRDER
jgi:hypothetical protein